MLLLVLLLLKLLLLTNVKIIPTWVRLPSVMDFPALVGSLDLVGF